MSYSTFLSGPMGSGIRPKKYFGATKELIRMKVLKSTISTTQKIKDVTPGILKTA